MTDKHFAPRIDHQIVEAWIPTGSRILDLGCGDGSLLKLLKEKKSVSGYGLDINPENIQQCIEKGVNIIEQNLDDGLSNFDDQSFDTVIMSQAIQTMQYPDKVLLEMLRVGKESIITFPNFGHWKARTHLLLNGRMPVSDLLPYAWYNTPNIHFCTIRDFEALCHTLNIRILKREVVNRNKAENVLQQFAPNFFGETAIYRVTQ